MVIEIVIVVAALLFASFLMALWRHRLRVIGLTFLLGSIYLLFTSDVFLVIRVPTICLVGFGIVLAIMIMFPTNNSKRPKKAARR